jgi:hypothetical protein
MTLKNGKLTVTFSLMDGNPSTRFEHLPYVCQIEHEGHSFLSRERTKAGFGTNGEGLMHGWLPDGPVPSSPFPIIGVGMLDLPFSEYSIRKNQPCDFISSSVTQDSDSSLTILAQQPIVAGYGYVLERRYVIDDNTLTVNTKIANKGRMPLAAKEYCHNFLLFDGIPIGPSYSVQMGKVSDLGVVRGEIALCCDSYRPLHFDPEIGTLAVSYHHPAKEEDAVTVSNMDSHTALRVENLFSSGDCYHWLSPWCLSPESYCHISLNPEDSYSFSRKYTVIS